MFGDTRLLERKAAARPVDTKRRTPRLTQRPTGIEGFDLLLRGGLVEGGVYLVLGFPGTGKTTLGNHFAFNHVKAGGNALYVTVVAETHDRMLDHLSGFDFLDFSMVGDRIEYLSVYDELNEHGLEGVINTLRRAIRERGHTLVVLDGAGIVEMLAGSAVNYSRFIADLSTQVNALNCTALLLSNYTGDPAGNPIAPQVDGIFVLEDRSIGLKARRYIHMVKVRGVGHVRGRHRFSISRSGVDVFPRLESVLGESISDPRADQQPLPTGVIGLDDVLRGGLLPGSMTTIWGPPGVGKTLLGLQYIIEGARQGEPVIAATFHENDRALSAMAQAFGHEFDRFVDEGLIRVVPNRIPEIPVDDWAWQLLARVDSHHPKRLLVDGISDVSRLGIEPDRLIPFFKALTGEFAARRITAVFTAEAHTEDVASLSVPRSGLAAASDNVILLRYIEVASRMHRLISVLKVRGGGHEHVAHEVHIGDSGIEIDPDPESASRILLAARQPWIDPGRGTNPHPEAEKTE